MLPVPLLRTTAYLGLLYKVLWKVSGLFFFLVGQGLLRTKLCLKRQFLKCITIFLQEIPIFISFGDKFNFSNACGVQTKYGTNKLLTKIVLTIMGYCQNGSEVETRREPLKSALYLRLKKHSFQNIRRMFSSKLLFSNLIEACFRSLILTETFEKNYLWVYIENSLIF